MGLEDKDLPGFWRCADNESIKAQKKCASSCQMEILRTDFCSTTWRDSVCNILEIYFNINNCLFLHGSYG